MSRLRCAVTRLGSLRGGSRAGRAKLILVGLFWPVKATVDCLLAVIKYGPRVKAMSGVGYARQWWDAMTLAHGWNYSPKTYYMYRFWDPNVRKRATSFVQVHELTLLQLSLNEGIDRSTISDKAVFDARCRQADLPSPTTVATLAPDSEEWAGDKTGLPHRDLFIKRVNGMQSIGSERWVFDATEERWKRRDEALTEAELIVRLRKLARSHPILVQHCLSNHPDIMRFSPGPLSTFRVITYRDDANAPILFAISLKMARSGADVDNLHAGGLACRVDPSTGELGPGIGRDPGEPQWLVHPDTHQPIVGSRLTTYRNVIDLALRAHRSLSVPWSVGWDVAMTPEGPVLVEGNAVWGAMVFHAPHRTGLPEDFARGMLSRVSGAA
ncbi:MAG: sugar-transfer associated ATP-grasp domain-containing protein [Gemmatimonadales bacterium]